MKRIQEKVKDLIEVRPYKILQDFIADAAQTLAVYHFTDVTSELMAKWMDKISSIQFQNGAAFALAGYRGVGKSHFLATVGAIVSHAELRSRIIDQHVAASAQRLKRSRYTVAYVRRGTHATLFDELKAAVAKAFAVDAAELSDSLAELLNFAAEKVGDLPFVLSIDTAFERSSRVARDDGVLLGEIAQIAKTLNMFVAVALDDDIAGADGINAAIAQNFSIDYLDQEHLYRIVDSHIFRKHRQTTPLLHDIYINFRGVLPNFRWSEQRFNSLYPLHPAILEIAPFVRLYAPEFALLGFAAEAGGKILGRPANSLIALDEVFDSVENTLRKVADLKDAFAAYDKLNAEVVGQISVMQRLQAKLVLKGLFLLSLEGDGTTAGEISAALLIYDENEPANSAKIVEDLLEKFVSAFPDGILRTAEEDREIRYSLKISEKDNLNTALNEAAKTISSAVIPKIFRRIARERFSDWLPSEEKDSPNADWMDYQITWRGGLRRGRMFWNLENRIKQQQLPVNSEFADWEVIIGSQFGESENSSEISRVYWQPAPLRKDEAETIFRYYVLLTDTSLREQFGEQIRAAGHAHILSVEKIWHRIFLEDAKLVIDGFDYKFSDAAKTSQTVAEMFSVMLEPLFEARYPNHPYFSETLGMTEVTALIKDFFSGARQSLVEVQQLAEIYAAPLGLVKKHGDSWIVESEENLVKLPLAEEILSLVIVNREKPVSLQTIYKQLKQSPHGLPREAQHLILTALVAQRQIEFVTTKGDRINRRSLDLTIIWDDIEGVAKPSSVLYGKERLTEWAKILTGSDAFLSIDASEDFREIKISLQSWLTDWQTARVLERFNELSAEILNTKIWRISTHAEKTFGVAAATVKMVLDESISLEEGLHRIADAFSDSEQEFFSCAKNLIVLEDFINGAAKREKIWTYLAICETTQDEKIEYFRDKLLKIIDESYANPSETLNREMENLWQTFHAGFAEHFSIKHDTIMKSHHLQEKFDEILRSDEWWEFENLSRLPIAHQNYRKEAQTICRQFKELDCRFDVREMLKTHPFCACSFNLSKIRSWETLPLTLQEIIDDGRKSYRNALRSLAETLVPLIEQFSAKNKDNEFSEASLNLIKILEGSEDVRFLDNNELIILRKVFESERGHPARQRSEASVVCR
ncbi:hypothetical protein BH20ACI1_BH20ACI1_02010 [soil metagenome]